MNSRNSNMNHDKLWVEKHRIHMALLGLYNFCSQFHLAMFYFLFFPINISFKTQIIKRDSTICPNPEKKMDCILNTSNWEKKQKWKVRLGQRAGNIYMENAIYEKFFSRIGIILRARSPLLLKIFLLFSKTCIIEQTSHKSKVNAKEVLSCSQAN